MEAYLLESELPEFLVRPYFESLQATMDQNIGEVITDETSGQRLKAILDNQVGETTLRDYYGRDPSANISNWSYRVKERVRKAVDEEGGFDC